jgi:hypothetical protein
MSPRIVALYEYCFVAPGDVVSDTDDVVTDESDAERWAIIIDGTTAGLRVRGERDLAAKSEQRRRSPERTVCVKRRVPIPSHLRAAGDMPS